MARKFYPSRRLAWQLAGEAIIAILAVAACLTFFTLHAGVLTGGPK